MTHLEAGVVVRRHSSASVFSSAGLQRLPMAVTAGLLVGSAECLFFLIALNHVQIEFALWRAFGISASAVQTSAIVACALAAVVAGSAFAWLAGHGRTGWQRVVLAGASLLLASLVGLVVALGLEPLGATTNAVLIFRVAFTLASGIAALLCTFCVARLLDVESAWRKAALVGAATATTYLLYALLIDAVPGFHVGGGNMAMPRVAMVGNLLAGAIGGVLAYVHLSRQSMSN
jgi:hypothetical protein